MPISTPALGMSPGSTIGPYRVANVPAGGAVGEALDARSGERVALKRLPDALAADAAALAGFRAMIDKLRALNHPNIWTCRGVEEYDGGAVLVMEYAPRGCLAGIVRSRGPMPWQDATRRLIEACFAIESAHAQGVVHGDVRPSNLLLNDNGTVKASDFSGGFVRPRTFDYSAPEVIAGDAATVASDIYSLGATYFALLSGHAPFSDAADDDALAAAHAAAPVPNVRAGRVDLPLRCEVIVSRAMAKAPADRFASVSDLRAELERVIAPAPERLAPLPPPARRRTWPSLTPLLFVAVIAAATYFSFFRPKPSGKTKTETPAVIARPRLTNYLGMTFVRPPTGTFEMGHRLLADAQPRLVRIARPFYIQTREVNQAEFQNVMGRNPSFWRHEQSPVDSVTWEEAREFCEKLSQFEAEKRAGRTYRLPTEAEWEYCCRAGSSGNFAFGPTLGVAHANFRSSGLLRTTPPGTYPPNAWGLHDMHGNLWEWCADWYKLDYYREAPVNDPPGPANGTRRVTRGGAFNSPPEDCTSAFRCDRFTPNERDFSVGFRVICLSPELEHDDER